LVAAWARSLIFEPTRRFIALNQKILALGAFLAVSAGLLFGWLLGLLHIRDAWLAIIVTFVPVSAIYAFALRNLGPKKPKNILRFAVAVPGVGLCIERAMFWLQGDALASIVALSAAFLVAAAIFSAIFNDFRKQADVPWRRLPGRLVITVALGTTLVLIFLGLYTAAVMLDVRLPDELIFGVSATAATWLFVVSPTVPLLRSDDDEIPVDVPDAAHGPASGAPVGFN